MHAFDAGGDPLRAMNGELEPGSPMPSAGLPGPNRAVSRRRTARRHPWRGCPRCRPDRAPHAPCPKIRGELGGAFRAVPAGHVAEAGLAQEVSWKSFLSRASIRPPYPAAQHRQRRPSRRRSVGRRDRGGANAEAFRVVAKGDPKRRVLAENLAAVERIRRLTT
jgi:hypothetical protein